MSMGNFHDMLIDGMKKFNLEIDNEQVEQFRMYCQLLTEWNKKMNLTAITEPSDIILKHFVDSCTVLHYVRIPQNARVIDVGTGAGFPGIPLKILRKDIRLTLLDSLNKRLIFLNEVAQQLEIEVETVHGRAEDIARQEKYREQFDVVVSRAVAPLNVLSEYCLPFVRTGGQFIAMKGRNVHSEVEESRKAVKLLGGKYKNVIEFHIEENGRSIVTVEKIQHTSAIYPRHGSKISRKPL